MDSFSNFKWVLTQHAPMDIPAISRPDLDNSQIIFNAEKISGTGIVRAEKAFVACSGMNDELRKFNAENNGYLLIVRTETGNVSSEPRGHASAFETDYFLNEYSNAGAILLCCYVIAGSIETHLGADKRALVVSPLISFKNFIS